MPKSVITESAFAYAISKLLRQLALSLPYRGGNFEALARKRRITCLRKDRHHFLPLRLDNPQVGAQTRAVKDRFLLTGLDAIRPRTNQRTADGISEGAEARVAVVDGKVGSLLPLLSFCSLIFRAYRSVFTAQPSRYSCTTSETPHPQKHTALSAEMPYQGILHKPSEMNTNCSRSLLSLPTSVAMSRTVSTATTKASTLRMLVMMERQKSRVDEGVKKALLQVEVYVNDRYVCV